MDEIKRFEGKVVLVTGAGRGLGRAAALRFARSGVIVAANDITPINLDQTLQDIREFGGEAREYIADISKMMPAQNMVDQVMEQLGGIDVLVSHASAHPHAPFFAIDEWDWRHTQDVNLNGAFFLTQLVGRAMRESGAGGVILYCLGRSGVLDEEQDAAGEAAFLASKMGLLGLLRAASQELSEFRIRVHAIDAWGSESGAVTDEEDQICTLMMDLCSPEAEHLNGLVIKEGRRFRVAEMGYRKRSLGV